MNRPSRPNRRKTPNSSGRGSSRAGQLRIIGGRWRGRRLPITDADGLRPTTDRTRETLFNWLAPQLADRRCLDLFAGTGALGIEALSRGAAHCDFVERNGDAAQRLRDALSTLDARPLGQVFETDALTFMESGAGPWDLVFVDPPFHSDLLERTLASLDRAPLAEDALIYLECAATTPAPDLPGWQCLREKTAGDVRYGLWERC